MASRLGTRRTRLAHGARGAWAVALAACAGCSTLFGLDVPPLLRGTGANPGGGEGGAAGEGMGMGMGEVAGAAPGGHAPGGFTGGGRGGAGAKGGTGGAGRAGLVGGASGGGNAGASPGGVIVRRGSPCDRPGALACPMASATSTVMCEDGVWSDGSPCVPGQYCDRRNGTCAPVYPGCADASPGMKRCAMDEESGGYDGITCGADLVSADLEQCLFDCQKNVGCLAPTGKQVVLEPEAPPLITDRAYWPGRTIPVCVTNPEATEWSVVEDEVARTWGRYGGIAFTGWRQCDAGATGVVATLTPHAEPCRGYLGSVDRIGYPGPAGTVNVTLCTRYYDAAGVETTAVEQLLRLVVRHEFGHVLGFPDASAPNSPGDFMSRALDTANVAQYPFGYLDVAKLVNAYGHKPSGAVVDERGDCLALESGEVSFAACDASPAQTFAFAGGALVREDSGECLSAAPSAGATAAACDVDPRATNDQSWQLSEVEIRAFGAQCLQIDEGGNVATAVCPEFGTPSALWTVEYVDGGTRVRLRQAGGADCLTVDVSDLSSSIAPCDDCPETDPSCATGDRFTVTGAGQIRIDGYCFFEEVLSHGSHANVPVPASTVELMPCTLSQSMLWSVSGQIESAVGTALTRQIKAGSPPLVASPTGNTMVGSQIFDFYFPHSYQ